MSVSKASHGKPSSAAGEGRGRSRPPTSAGRRGKGAGEFEGEESGGGREAVQDRDKGGREDGSGELEDEQEALLDYVEVRARFDFWLLFSVVGGVLVLAEGASG